MNRASRDLTGVRGVVAAAALMLLGVGCLPNFKNPLRDDGVVVDATVYEGSWVVRSAWGDTRMADGRPATVTRTGLNRLRAVSRSGDDEAIYEVRLARVADRTFASYRAEGSQQSWRIVRLDLEDEGRRLVVKTVRIDLVKAAIEAGELRGVVLEEGSGDGWIGVNSDEDTVRSFVAANSAAFDGEVLVMERSARS